MQNFQVQFLKFSLAFYAICPAHRLLYDFDSTLGPATVHLSILFSQPNLLFPLYGHTFINIQNYEQTYNSVHIYLYAFKQRRTDLKLSVGKI